MKKVVLEINKEVVGIEDCNPDKIYLAKGSRGYFYKAQRISGHYDGPDTKYVFMSLDNSYSFANSIHKGLKKLLIAGIDSDMEIFEFKKWDEAVEFMAEIKK